MNERPTGAEKLQTKFSFDLKFPQIPSFRVFRVEKSFHWTSDCLTVSHTDEYTFLLQKSSVNKKLRVVVKQTVIR